MDARYLWLYTYKIVRLIILAGFITYFAGCSWYFISSTFNGDNKRTFLTVFNFDKLEPFDKLVISCYFALVTLSTVGYGDFYPISNVEQIFGMIIMLGGVALFSYILSSFIEIISNYDRKNIIVDKNSEML